MVIVISDMLVKQTQYPTINLVPRRMSPEFNLALVLFELSGAQIPKSFVLGIATTIGFIN